MINDSKQPSLISDSLPDTQSQELSPENKVEVLQKAKRIIEALLFCTTEPVSLKRISNVLQSYHSLETSEVKKLIEELSNDYRIQNRGFRLDEIAKGYLLRSCEEFSPYIHNLLKITRPERLSQAATEVLAIIAFRQPITRPQVDEIRGVDSSGIISTLIERELIEPTGKLEAPGRPTLYGITNHFLKYFGMKDLTELPTIPK
jgi:segregation and condensation protein B